MNNTRIKDRDVLALKEKIAQRLERVRLDQLLTQDVLAEELGTTQNLIFRSEHGLKVSLDTLFLMMLYYQKNYKLNIEWLLSPDNTGISPYMTDTRVQRRRNEARERQRHEILVKMLKELNQEGLLPENLSEINTDNQE